MSTAATVRAAWSDHLWAADAIKAISPQIYDFDIQAIATVSQEHYTKLFYGQEINFWQYRVRMRRAFGMTGKLDRGFLVQVRYCRDAELDLNGTKYNAVEDAFETLFTQIRSVLGNTWDSTVDYWEVDNAEPSIVPVLINGRPTWQGDYAFLGHQETVLS